MSDTNITTSSLLQNRDFSSTKLSKVGSVKRRSKRGRTKFNFLFCVWTIIFLYYGLTAEDTQLANAATLPADDDEQRTGKYFTNGYSYSISYSSSTSPDIFPDETGVSVIENGSKNNGNGRRRNKYAESEVPGFNCTPPGIDDFPEDLFTQQQRQQGWVVVHFLVSIYIFYALAVVCDDYFVPTIERICEELHIPSDVAGATFMAVATSAPELFTNIIGTFITRGDIGVGAIVGSAVFNILCIAAVCGLGAGMVVYLEWWSVTRDCLCYSVTVILLIIVLRDERIYWYEAMILVIGYLVYILIMYKNSQLKQQAEKLVHKASKRISKKGQVETTYITKSNENGKYTIDTTDIGEGQCEKTNGNRSKLNGLALENNSADMNEIRDEMAVEQALKNSEDEAQEKKEEGGLFAFPKDEGCRAWIEFIIGWPIRFVFTFTIPDCREERWKKWYPLTFLMCVVWIGALAYIVNWMLTVAGHTLMIPDSVTGLTFIAAGTSVPEIVSSLIVARQGLGTMAVSNSIGSNTFDILCCLGIPWFIRALMDSDDEKDYIQINSTGLEYSTMMLIASLAVLYIILALNRFVLDRKVGLLALFLYILFVIMASLFELNVFFTVNLPTCKYHED